MHRQHSGVISVYGNRQNLFNVKIIQISLTGTIILTKTHSSLPECERNGNDGSFPLTKLEMELKENTVGNGNNIDTSDLAIRALSGERKSAHVSVNGVQFAR